jgi:hypothetical protein
LINGGDSYYGFNEERERTVGFFCSRYTYDRRYTGSITGRLMTGQTDKEIVIHHGGCLLTLLVVNGISWGRLHEERDSY